MILCNILRAGIESCGGFTDDVIVMCWCTHVTNDVIMYTCHERQVRASIVEREEAAGADTGELLRVTVECECGADV